MFSALEAAREYVAARSRTKVAELAMVEAGRSLEDLEERLASTLKRHATEAVKIVDSVAVLDVADDEPPEVVLLREQIEAWKDRRPDEVLAQAKKAEAEALAGFEAAAAQHLARRWTNWSEERELLEALRAHANTGGTDFARELADRFEEPSRRDFGGGPDGHAEALRHVAARREGVLPPTPTTRGTDR